jgi:hypothetical protein
MNYNDTIFSHNILTVKEIIVSVRQFEDGVQSNKYYQQFLDLVLVTVEGYEQKNQLLELMDEYYHRASRTEVARFKYMVHESLSTKTELVKEECAEESVRQALEKALEKAFASNRAMGRTALNYAYSSILWARRYDKHFKEYFDY